ncbi:hypothetical protein SCHPADRAFT_997570 [Schizopora paradoxa]|uniref:DUF6533 domain-containing protein n=1 Tax=Schizopora paradoxa TaxID=27342 RepID=A0A0H2S8D2_9AGAM|nr:hypothetical protein SCHPADRAFT_997570 [Schizopora paradoxa]
MDQIPPSVLAPIYHEVASQGIGTKYGLVAAYTILVYDAMITNADEIEYVWKRSRSAVTFLFFMNRYYAICVATIASMQAISPLFNETVCKRMIYFQPLAVGIPLTFFPNFVIGLRVYALYGRNRALAAFLTLFLLGEFGVALWLYLTPTMFPAVLPGPESVTNSQALHVCLATNSPKLDNLQAAAYQIMQTVYDSCCLGLTLRMTLKESIGVKSMKSIRQLITKHGIIYYVVVFTLNLSWALMILLATMGLKYTMSGATLALAPVAANRLILSLRRYSMSINSIDAFGVEAKAFVCAPPSGFQMKRRNSWVGTSTFEVDGDMIKEKESAEARAYELDFLDHGSDRRSSLTLTVGA